MLKAGEAMDKDKVEFTFNGELVTQGTGKTIEPNEFFNIIKENVENYEFINENGNLIKLEETLATCPPKCCVTDKVPYAVFDV